MSGFISNLWSDLSGPVSETIEEGKEYGKQGIRLLRWVWMPFVLAVSLYNFSDGEWESASAERAQREAQLLQQRQ